MNLNENNAIINKKDEEIKEEDFFDAKAHFTVRTNRPQDNSDTKESQIALEKEEEEQENKLLDKIAHQGDQTVQLEGDNLMITCRGGKQGKEQVIQAYDQMEVVSLDHLDRRDSLGDKHLEFKSKNKDLKLRDLNKIWREKTKFIKATKNHSAFSTIQFTNLKWDNDFKFSSNVGNPEFFSYIDTLNSKRFIDVARYPSHSAKLVKDMLNIINIKISKENINLITLSEEGNQVVLRPVSNDSFFLFSLKDPIIMELIDQVLESEYEPMRKGVLMVEDDFQDKINKVVNKYSIQNFSFTDIKFVPENSSVLQTAGANFIALWQQNSDLGSLEIKEKRIQTFEDPKVAIIQPVDINTLFLIGEDNCLYIKIFDHPVDLSEGRNRSDSRLTKDDIALVHLYKFPHKVTDFFVNSSLKTLQVADDTGDLQKLSQILKERNPICKLDEKFTITDSQAISKMFSKVQATKIQDVKGIGQMIQRNDNRLLLQSYDKNEQILKLKDFELSNHAQISFNQAASTVIVPCKDSGCRVFDQLDAPTGQVNPVQTGKKMKNSSQNAFKPYERNNPAFWLQANEELCNQQGLKANSMQFGFTDDGKFGIFLTL